MTATAGDAPSLVVPVAPRINALQRLWLREIGIEKTWVKAAEPLPGATQSIVGIRAVVQARAPATVTTNPSSVVVNVKNTVSSTVIQPSAPSIARDTSTTVSHARSPKTDLGRIDAIKVVSAVALPVNNEVSSASFEVLSEQVRACTACGLHQGRRHAVFGEGPRPARWMIIGEAPGEQEDREGLPFVGRSGQLLSAMLAAAGMSRERDVFIANVIKCRPPANRNPKSEEIEACSPYLTRQIELVQPERILVLGRFAAQTLLKTDATISSLRGRQHEWTTTSGRRIPVVVSYHPAYLLRSPTEKARAWQDLQLALTTIN